MAIEIVTIFVLIIANGIFAGTELAVLSSKKGRLQQSAAQGNPGAATALRLQEDPNRFLSAVQVGITLISTLTGAFGGASLANRLAPTLKTVPYLAPYADTAALILVVLAITYFSLVFGELVPKRIALLRAEGYATFVAPPMAFIARLSAPVVTLLSWSTQLVLRLVGLGRAQEERVTEEDILHTVREGIEGGVVDPEEHQMIERVFDLGDRTVRQIMTPRHEAHIVDAEKPIAAVVDDMLKSGYSRFPVYADNSDNIVGIVHVRDLLSLYRSGKTDQPVGRAATPPIFVPENSRAALLLPLFRKQQRHMALVVGELGGIEGLVTLEDVIEEIVGEIADEYDEAETEAIVRRDDGSLLIDGSLPVDRLKDLLNIEELPDEEIYRFDTLAGFVLSLMGQIPRPGSSIVWSSWRFEVVDMDGLRIDKVLITEVRA